MTTYQFLAALHVRGVRLSCDRDRLVIDAPAGILTEADRHLLGAHKEELLAVVDFGPDLAVLVAWFRQLRAAGELPHEPFTLAPWQQVVEPARFYAALELDIAIGPGGPRARFGGLGGSLRRLRAFVESRDAGTTSSDCPN